MKTVKAMKGAIICKMPYSSASNPGILQRRTSVAKPNYNFEKRQKELAKKKKKEEKRLQKAGVVEESQPQDVQPIPGNDDKAVAGDNLQKTS